MRRFWFASSVIVLAAMTTAASCQPIPSSDTATPQNFLGEGKADIRVYGKEDPGIATLVVTGRASGRCSTGITAEGQVFTSPGSLTATLPTQAERAPAGQVQNFLAASLDSALAGKISCGTHISANMSRREEFFLDSGTWTLHAEAVNCCGNKGVGDFTVVVR